MKGAKEAEPQKEAEYKAVEPQPAPQKRIRFAEHPKDITENIPQEESSEEETDTSVDDEKVKKTKQESSEDESDVSRDVDKPSSVATTRNVDSRETPSSDDSGSDEVELPASQKTVQLPINKGIQEAPKGPGKVQTLSKSDEFSSDDEKESSSEGSSESHEEVPYTKLPHSLPSKEPSNRSPSTKSTSDEDQTAPKDTQSVVASAAVTALCSSFSPTSRKNTEDLQNADKQETKTNTSNKNKPKVFHKIPNENAVVVPLHGSSKEEEVFPNEEKENPLQECRRLESEGQAAINNEPNRMSLVSPLKETSLEMMEPVIDEGDGLIQTVPSTSPETNRSSLLKEKVGDTQKKPQVFLKLPRESEVIVSSTLADQASSEIEEPKTSDSLTPELQNLHTLQRIYGEADRPGVHENKMRAKNKPRIFKKVPNENAVFVPLHSSSDENEKTFKEDISGTYKRLEASESETAIGEKDFPETSGDYLVYVPLTEDRQEKAEKGQIKEFKNNEEFAVSHPSIATAAFTSLFSAFSPFGSQDTFNNTNDHSVENNQPENIEDDLKATKSKPKIFKKVPNQNAVYIPLHSSCEDDFPPEGEEVADNFTSSKNEHEPKYIEKSETEINIDIGDGNQEPEEIIDSQLENKDPTKQEDSAITQPSVATAAYTALFSAFSPLGVHESHGKENEGTIDSERSEEQKLKKKKIFKKVPNENAFYVPLHSSSEEDIQGEGLNPQDVDSPTTGLVERVSKEKVEDTEQSNKYPQDDELLTREANKKSFRETPPVASKEEEDIEVTNPTIATAAFSSLFSAFSPLSSQGTTGVKKSEECVLQEKNHEEQTKVKKKQRQRIFKKVPNENAVYVPLHSSEEDIIQDEESDNNPDTSNNATGPNREMDLEEPNKYAVYVPLSDEKKAISKVEGETGKKQLPTSSKEEDIVISTPTIASAAFTSLFTAFSPLGSHDSGNNDQPQNTTPQKETIEKDEQVVIKMKPKVYKKVPNLDAVYIPLHSSEEDPDQDEEPNNVAQVQGLTSEDSGKIEEHYGPKNSSAPCNDDGETDENQGDTKLEEETPGSPYKDEELVVNTPSVATAAFSSLFSVFSPLGSSGSTEVQAGTSQMEANDSNISNSIDKIPQSGTPEDEYKLLRKKRPRIFKKVPNENAVYIPLHSSEEDILYGEESNGNFDSSIREPTQELSAKEEHEEPNKYAVHVPLHEDGKTNAKDVEDEKEVARIEEVAMKNPALATAAFSSFFHAISPLGSNQDSNNDAQSNKNIVQSEKSEDEEDVLTKEKPAILKNVLNEDAACVTLNSSEKYIPKDEEPQTNTKCPKSSTAKKSDKDNDEKGIPIIARKHAKENVEKENVILSQPSVATAAFTALYSASISPAAGNSLPDSNSSPTVKAEDASTDSTEDSKINNEDPEIILSSSETIVKTDAEKTDVKSEENYKIQEDNLTFNAKRQKGYQDCISDISQTTVATAAFTSLFTALSPLGEKGSVGIDLGEKEIHHPKRRKPRMFKKVPNENAVYVPLHSSSEEEKSCEEDAIGDDSNGDINNLHETEAPNEYKIFVPLNEDEPKQSKKRGNKAIEISQPSVAAAAFTALFSAFSPLGTTEQIKCDNRDDLPPESDDLTGAITGQPKKPRPVFKKIPNEDAFYVPLKASFDEEDTPKELTNMDEPTRAKEPSDALNENKTERKDAGEINITGNDLKKTKIGKNIDNGSKVEKNVVQEKSLEMSSDVESKIMQKNDMEKVGRKNDAPKEEKSVVKSILKKTNISRGKSPKAEDYSENENGVQLHGDKRDKVVREERSSPEDDTHKKQILKSRSKKNEKNKNVSEENNENFPEAPKKVKVKEIEVQTKPIKTVKLADIVLDVLTKKDKDNSSEAGNVERSSEARSSDQLTEDTTSCDHEYEPIQAPRQAPRAASQPDVRSPPLDVQLRREEVGQPPLKEQVQPPRKEEEDRYEVVRPSDGPAIQEATLSLQADGGYEVIEEPRKEQRRCIKIPDEDAIIVPLHGSSDEEINPDRYQNPALMMSEEEIESFPRQPLPYVNIPSKNMPKAQSSTQEGTFQEKLRTQADRFTTKLRGISKPNIVIHKPKIKIPERPHIKMPEMPKMKLPERPKFNLPNRPKLNFPEFHLPDRSKFHLPEKPKFLTERPKFLSERPSFKLPERFTRHEKKPKAPKGKKPNPSSQRRPLRDVVTISSQSTPGSTQNIFETLKFKTYPRFFKKKKAPPIQKMSSLDTESSQPSTPPRRPRRFSDQQQDVEWVHAYDRDIKFADEDTQFRIERMEEEYEREENAPFQDNYEEDSTNLEEEEDLPKGKAESLTSVVSEKGSSGSSSHRRRAGVIEEIDSDEFFVRQKGLSREDVDVSRYLSLEIRDAFRHPKNALASLDHKIYDDDEQTPRAPERRRSRKSDHFHTFPKRPSRRKESDPEPGVKPPRRFRSKSGGRGRQSSMPSLSMEPLPQPPSRKSRERSLRSLNREGRASDLDIVQPRISAQNSGDIPPVAPLRKSRSRGTSLADDDRTSRGADSLILPDDDVEVPQPPLAERELDDEILMDEEIEVDVEEEEVPVQQVKHESSRALETIEIEERYTTDYSGYAVVTKDRKKPPRPPPPPSQHFDFHSQLDNIKATGKNIFFTYPRRAMKSLHKPFPQRPLRNYNTVGPVRPPRRNRVFRKPVYMTGEAPTSQEAFIDKERDLQSGEVVSRMKGRPLPPPPRPPRKSRDYDELIGEINESSPTETLVASTEVEVSKDEEPETKQSRRSYFQAKTDEFLQTISKYSPFESKKEEEAKEQITTSQQTSFEFGEVSVSIQTDPLPKDVIVIDQEIEETEEILILSDSNGKESREERSETDNLEKTKQSVGIKESKSEEDIKLKEPEESIESNIFQQALERVEAARGVLKEARERVIPGSTTSLDERKTADESENLTSKISLRGSLPASSRSEGIEKEETPPPLPARPHYTKPIPVSFPDKLHLSELDVDKLNVSEIQANKIKVSEIESTCIDVTELTSRGGNLTLNGLELPPDFISTVVSQVTSQVTSQVASQVASQVTSHVQSQMSQQMQSFQAQRELTPQRQVRRVLTPPPSIVVQASAEPISAPEPIVPQTKATEHIPQPRTTRSKGRRSPTRVIDDSEDELASMMPQRRDKEKEKKGKRGEEMAVEEKRGKAKGREEKGVQDAMTEDPELPSPPLGQSLGQASSLQLLGRLLSIWQGNISEGAGTFVQGVNSLFPEGEKRRDAQIAAVILLILITGLILIGFGFDHSVHHHHWDYLPPR